MGKGFGLGFCGRRSNESCLGFGWGGGRGKEVNFFGDGVIKVLEVFFDVWGVVVSFVLVL